MKILIMQITNLKRLPNITNITKSRKTVFFLLTAWHTSIILTYIFGSIFFDRFSYDNDF